MGKRGAREQHVVYIGACVLGAALEEVLHKPCEARQGVLQRRRLAREGSAGNPHIGGFL